MQTWAQWVFAILAIEVLIGVVAIPVIDYPREIERGSDVVELIINIVLLVWGATAIW